jgi:tetratricopeptide (TPR) repeat protein
LTVQLTRKCLWILDHGIHLFLYLEVIAFGRELIRVAPAGPQPHCYFHCPWAMMGLQKLGGAEEILHEGLAACQEEGLGMSRVSRTSCRIPHAALGMVQAKQSDTPQLWHHIAAFWHWSLTFALRSQILRLLAQIAFDRGDLEVALDFAHRAAHTARELIPADPAAVKDLSVCLIYEALILESLGRLDEAMDLDDEWLDHNPGRAHTGASARLAIRCISCGADAKAEQLLRRCPCISTDSLDRRFSRKMIMEGALKTHTMLADLLERRGTEEALAEARTLRDEVAQQLAGYEATRSAAFEETRAAAAEAVRQWREERIKAIEKKKGGKTKGKKKGRRGKAKGQGPPSAAMIEGEAPHEPAGGEAEAEGAAAGEGAAAAGAEQHPVGQAQPLDEEEETEEEEEVREECAICLQDLELEDDEDSCTDEGEVIVMLQCGHRFHEICGDMWCAKCADKGWGVTCPRCRALYVVERS